MATQKTIEPAIKSYFFGKGYADFFAVIKGSWQANGRSAKSFKEKMPGASSVFDIIRSSFWACCAISVVMFGTLFFGVISIVHFVLLVIFLLPIYLSFVIFKTIESLVLLIRQHFLVCPHCYKKYPLPVYICPSCKAEHRQLLPNVYGIFFHKCQCGAKLPSSLWTNRRKLQAKCPNSHCDRLLKAEHLESKKIEIPIWGGPSVGKSVFMFAVAREMLEGKAEAAGYRPVFIDKTNEFLYNQTITQIKRGMTPDKTANSMPSAFELAFNKGAKIEWLFKLYDPAGEVYSDATSLSHSYYLERSAGTILIVDPFSLSEVRKHYELQLSRHWKSLRPSQASVEDIVDRIIITLEQSFNLAKKDKIKAPLAIVLSKCDAFDLDSLIGVQALGLDKNASILEQRQKRNQIIRQQLLVWNESALVQKLEARFANIGYFSCSALGRIPDKSNDEFHSSQVFEPIAWICECVDKETFSRMC